MPSVAERLRAIADALPDGAAVTIPAAAVREWLAEEPTTAPPAPVAVAEPLTWRERLWTCPPDTRLGVRELAEALGRSRDWCYRATNATRAAEHGRDPLPCQRLDGVLVFTAGAVRRWLQASECVVNPALATARLHVPRAARPA
ncbi:MAG TPA: hypothetical protein VJL28_00470 [Gemmatimonadaceae bacterium]|nr:hypothetical protein [Gemmatimonadaceae bacterium]